MSVVNYQNPPRPKVDQFLVLNRVGGEHWRLDACADTLEEAKQHVFSEVHPNETTLIVQIKAKRNYF